MKPYKLVSFNLKCTLLTNLNSPFFINSAMKNAEKL